MPIRITEPSDERVALYRGLRDSELRRRTEEEHGVFVAEGPNAVKTLMASRWKPLSILTSREAPAAITELAEQRAVPVYAAGAAVIEAIAGFPFHRGILALASRTPPLDPSTSLAGVKAAVVVEGVNDHENLGAIFRNASALGAGAVFLDPATCDPLYRRSVRVSQGYVLRVPFTRLVPWPDALDGLADAGFSLVALDPSADETVESVRVEGKPALMVGSEGQGLSAAARGRAVHRVRIPMSTGVDSLNVATALAIALHRLVAP